MKNPMIDSNPRNSGRRALSSLLAILFVLGISSGRAGQDTWTGAGNTEFWDNSANWSGGHQPKIGDDVIMLGPGHTVNTADNGGYVLNSIQYPTAAPNFLIHIGPTLRSILIAGNAGSGIFNFSGRLQLIDVDEGFANTLTFDLSAVAGQVQIENKGGALGLNLSNGGTTIFQGNSSAGVSTINNFGTTDSPDENNFLLAGKTSFRDHATAGSALIANIGGAVDGAPGGATNFSDTSVAGNATIHNLGATATDGEGGGTTFEGNSTAGSAMILNDGSNEISGRGSAGTTLFTESASAENASTTNNAGMMQGGETDFIGGTAGHASITNNGAGPFGDPGKTGFLLPGTSAGEATIINNGGGIFLGRGGETSFTDGATAENATLIANAGAPGSGGPGKGGIFIPGGQGGSILFFGDSSGGTARVEVFGNGNLDISGHNASGVTVGSLEGDGQAYLGANNLSVGSNNTDTTFAGPAHDGGNSGGVGGSLSKVGLGTWTLTGTSDYTGATIVSSGKLVVDGNIATSSGVTVNSGATLGGHGVVSSIGGAGTIAPGNSPGILTATQVDPSAGTDFQFEFTKTGSPNYGNATASGNDVLHLMDLVPFTSALDSNNQITIDFSGASLAVGQLYRGGFFTDKPINSSFIADATFLYLGLNGLSVHFDGFVTEPLADFAGGTITNGSILQFDIEKGTSSVPDWSPAWLLLALGLFTLLTLRLVATKSAHEGDSSQSF